MAGVTELRRCSSCQQWKPIEQFWRKQRNWDHLQEWCKSCIRSYRLTNREIERDQDRARARRALCASC
jgi:Stc1 domain